MKGDQVYLKHILDAISKMDLWRNIQSILKE
jgi:hypothetical protein